MLKVVPRNEKNREDDLNEPVGLATPRSSARDDLEKYGFNFHLRLRECATKKPRFRPIGCHVTVEMF